MMKKKKKEKKKKKKEKRKEKENKKKKKRKRDHRQFRACQDGFLKITSKFTNRPTDRQTFICSRLFRKRTGCVARLICQKDLA